MKRFLLMLFVVFSICACSQKESKPNIELEEGDSSPANIIAGMTDSINNAVNTDKGEPQPYYFSEGLKNAVANCTPYTEELYEKNPDMKEAAASLFSMFSDKIDTSSFKFVFSVKGKKNDKCQILLSYDYSLSQQDLSCELSKEVQENLAKAMNDKSTETKTKTFKSGFVSTTMTAREFDLALAEITSGSCQAAEPQMPSEDKIKEMQHKMLAFSDRFKNSLKNCTPDTEVFKVMGMEMNKAKIKGKEKGKCHVVLQGFHILLNDNELSLSGFDELGELLSDETRVTYSPSYKYQGTMFALSNCEQLSKNKNNGTDLGSATEELSLNDQIQITRGVNSSYKNNICKVLFTLKVKRNGKEDDHSLNCELTTPQVTQYLSPYNTLVQQYAPKISASEFSFSLDSMGKQTEEVSKADQDLFLKMYKAGICKKTM